MSCLKAGKRWLREQKPVNAFREFEKALPLAKQLKDTVEEKKAARGLGESILHTCGSIELLTPGPICVSFGFFSVE